VLIFLFFFWFQPDSNAGKEFLFLSFWVPLIELHGGKLLQSEVAPAIRPPFLSSRLFSLEWSLELPETLDLLEGTVQGQDCPFSAPPLFVMDHF